MNKRILKIISNSQAVIFYCRATVNRPAEYVSKNIEIFGYYYGEFLSGMLHYADIIHPDDRQRVTEAVINYTNRGVTNFRQTYRILDKAGQTRWIDDHTQIERATDGTAEYYLATIIDITEQKTAEMKNFLLANIVDYSSDEVYVFDYKSWQFSYLNQVALDQIGYSLEEALKLSPLVVKSDLDSADFKTLLAPLLDADNPQSDVMFETMHCDKDGHIYPVDVKIQLLELDGRQQYVAVVRNISERKVLQAQREEEHRFVQEVIDGVAESVMVINADYTLALMNNTVKKMIKPEFIANPDKPKCYEVSHHRLTPCNGPDHPCPLNKALDTQKEVSVIHNHGREGHAHYVELLAKPLKDKNGQAYAIVESTHDITSLIQAQEALRKQADTMAYYASHDALTGLPNRRLFEERLDQAIEHSARLSLLMSVVFIDIDKFKEINDQMGHQAGDEVLIEVAERLKACLRTTDTVARLGGDEFTLILEGVAKSKELPILLHKIMLAFDEPVKTNAGPIDVSLSAGLSIYPQDAMDRKTLLRYADMALYNVKINGRKGFKFFDEMKNNG